MVKGADANQAFLPIPIFASTSVRYSKKSDPLDDKNTQGYFNPIVAFSGGGGSTVKRVTNSIVR